jgi:glutaredoxin 3
MSGSLTGGYTRETLSHPSDQHRCAVHDLDAGPDGRCVLCRREQASGASGVGAGLIVGLLAVLGIASALAVGYRGARLAAAEATAAAVVDDGVPPADLADATRRVQIKVYSTSWCPHCQRAKAWLKSGGHPFAELDVERDAAAQRDHRRLSRSGGVPVIEVDGSVLQGFDAAATDEAIRHAAERRMAAR